jgi:hypothetical protein
MRHIAQQMIAVEVRRPYLNRYRRRLRESLQNPGLAGSERTFVQEKLNNAGKTKIYDAEAPSPPGAIDPGPMPQPPIEVDDSTRESLMAETHTRLFLFAKQLGLEVQPNFTKAQVIETLLSRNQGEKE